MMGRDFACTGFRKRDELVTGQVIGVSAVVLVRVGISDIEWEGQAVS